VVWRNLDAVEAIDCLLIGITASVSDPESAGSPHDRIERSRHAAGRLNAFDRADSSPRTPVLERFAI